MYSIHAILTMVYMLITQYSLYSHPMHVHVFVHVFRMFSLAHGMWLQHLVPVKGNLVPVVLIG